MRPSNREHSDDDGADIGFFVPLEPERLSAHPRRSTRIRVALTVLLLLVAACSAAVGLSWNRTKAIDLTPPDALRILNGAGDSAERERAMSELARLAIDVVQSIKRAGVDGTRESKYAEPRLKQIREALDAAVPDVPKEPK